MKLFSIFPHTAYLNTEIHIVSESVEDIVITNTTTDEKFKLTKEEHRVLKLPAGRHLFKCENKNGVQIEEINVENGIKLGGSKLKKTYLFEESPWVVVVMKDRTYFYNRETEREFVEYYLVPEEINTISKNHLLITSKKRKLIFSLKYMAPIISFHKKLYIDDKYLIIDETLNKFDSLKRLSIYSYIDNSRRTLTCSEYSIDSKNKTIYTFENGIIYSFNIENFLKKEILKVDNNFKCFIQCQYVIFENTKYKNKELKLYDLQKRKENNLLRHYKYPIVSINNKSINNETNIKENFNTLINLRKDNYDAIQVNMTLLYLYIYIIDDYIYYITNTSSSFSDNYNNKNIKTKNYYTIQCNTTNYKKEIEIDYYTTIEIIEDTLIINHNEEVTVLKNGKEIIVFKNGRLIKTPTKYVYYIRNNNIDYIYNLNNDLIHKGIFETNYLATYGVLISKNNGDASHLFYIGNKHPYYTREISHISEEDNKLLVFTQNNPYPSIHINGREMPFLYKSIDSISKNGLLCLNIDGNKLILSTWDSSLKGFTKKEILSSLYDSNFFSDAYFTNEGSSIVYKKFKEDNYVFFDVFNQQKIEFDNINFIQNSNGYRPLIDFDSYRNPVIIDPVTMQSVPSDYLSQYQFVSPDGNYYVKTDRKIEYYHKILNKQISKNKYDDLCNEYNYSQYNVERLEKRLKILKRKELIKEHNLTDIDDYIINGPNFVDKVVVDIIEYLFVKDVKNNKTITIKLGSPPLWFLNYVSFSYNNKYIAIAGRYPNKSGKSGLFLLYDIIKEVAIYESTQSNAVWITAFSKNGEVCYYTSNPVTYRIDANDISKTKSKRNRNFLCFSPSGKYIAMSNQGYKAKSSNKSQNNMWGHKLSSEIFVHLNNESFEEKYYFNDHGDGIKGIGNKANNVAFAAISNDDKKLLSISNDGVIIVRNLD